MITNVLGGLFWIVANPPSNWPKWAKWIFFCTMPISLPIWLVLIVLAMTIIVGGLFAVGIANLLREIRLDIASVLTPAPSPPSEPRCQICGSYCGQCGGIYR